MSIEKKDNNKIEGWTHGTSTDDESQIFVEVKKDAEVVKVDNKEQLKELNKLEEVKEVEYEEPKELPIPKEKGTCGHWERELKFLSQTNNEVFLKTQDDIVTGGYCPDCKQNLDGPKDDHWYPRETYKKK